VGAEPAAVMSERTMPDEERCYTGLVQLKSEGGACDFDPAVSIKEDAAQMVDCCIEGPGFSLTITGRDNFEFSSGAKCYALYGSIGIDPEGRAGGEEGDSLDDLTPDQRREVAAYMIDRWRRFAHGT
jgi:hypothetical protein